MDRKFFGVPYWVIGAILGFVIVAFIYMRSSAQRATSTASGYPAVNTDVAGALEGDGSANSEASSSTSGTSGYITNDLWEAAVVTYLTTQGNSPLTCQAAIESYLSGTTLTSDQANLLNQAIAKFGLPPQGVSQTPTISTSTSSSSVSTPITAVPDKISDYLSDIGISNPVLQQAAVSQSVAAGNSVYSVPSFDPSTLNNISQNSNYTASYGDGGELYIHALDGSVFQAANSSDASTPGTLAYLVTHGN